MNSKSGIKTTKKTKPELGSGPNQSRRSFAKASLLAPVILSLANRPAWGMTKACMVSGFSSVMETGSGDPGNSGTCGYVSSGDILDRLSTDSTGPADFANIINQQISTIFACTPSYNPTIGDTLRGSGDTWTQDDPWTYYMVMAYYNALLYDNNPFPCPVANVFCHFETPPGGALNLGNVTLTQAETLSFLMKVLP